MPNNMRLHKLLFCLAILVFAVGCGDKQRLRGKITFSDDGSPLTQGMIFFATDDFLSRADILPNGSYTVGSTGKSDGIPYGEYSVYIAGADNIEFSTNPTTGEQREKRTPLIDPKYQFAETSGLKFTANGKTKRFDILVDRPKKGKK